MKNEGQKRILLVEDEALIAMAGKMTLEKYGYEAITASTGEKAVKTVETTPDIDLILMDIDLGRGIDGTEAAVKILDKHDLPLIFLSSHTEREVVEKTEGITSYGYIVKNTGETVLIASIKMAFRLFEANAMKRAKEDELQESELKFRGLVETSSDWIWEVNTKGVYTYASPKVEDILGYRPEEVTGKTPFDMMPQEEAVRIREIFTDLVNAGKPIVSLENVSLHKDGRRITLETSGVPFFDSDDKVSGYRGVDRDITERKQIEMALREREERLSSLTDQSPLAIQIFDTDGFVVQVNRAWEQLWGAPLEELVRLEYNILKDEQAKKVGLIPYLEKAYSGEVVSIPPSEYDASVSSETGNKRWVQSHVYPLRDESGKVVNIVALQEDITERIKTENALKGSESLYRNLIETSTEGIVLTDLEGKYTFCNQRHACLLGYDTAEELIGKNGFDFFDPESLKRAEKTLQDLFIDKHIENIIFEVVRKDGSRILTEFSATVIYDEQQNPINIMCLMKDVTERQKAEKALQNISNQYQRLIENIGDNFLIYSHKLDGTLTYVNSGIETVFGLAEEEAIGSDWVKIIDWESEDLELAGENVHNIISGLEYKRIEMSFRHPDGQQRTVFISPHPIKDRKGAVVAIEGIAEDITERKQAEVKLKNSEELFRLVTQTSEIGITNTDLISGKVMWDETCYKIHGYKLGTPIMLDYYIDKIVLPDEKIRVMPEYRSALDSKDNRYRIQYRIARPDGSVRWLDEDHAIVRDENGKAIRTYSAKIDITERKQAEETIKSLLQEKTMLLKEVHHRIKNNMNVMRSLFSLQSRAIDSPEAVSALKDAIGRIDSMGVLYDKLYRTESYQDVSVKEYLPQLVDEIFQMFPNRMNIKLETKMDDFTIDTRIIFPLGIIINELLTNAIKYAFIGRDSGLIQLSSTLNENHVTIVFEDNGIGIPELKGNEEQKGFGITLIGLLTEQIAGSYKIERNNGTKFILEFDI